MRLKKGKHRVLVISDLQEPFAHKDAIRFLEYVARKYKTDKTVCIGDSLDNHCLGRWDQDPDGMGAKDEYFAGIKELKKLYAIFPEAVEVASNHNSRLAKKALNSGLPSVFIKDYAEIMQYPPGWCLKDHHIIDGVMYEHGDSYGGIYAARNAAIHNGCSTVIGHFHSHASVSYIANNRHMIFGCNCGCLIDIEAYAFKYGKTMKFKPTLTCAVVLGGVPIVVPMMLGRGMRWSKNLQDKVM